MNGLRMSPCLFNSELVHLAGYGYVSDEGREMPCCMNIDNGGTVITPSDTKRIIRFLQMVFN